MKKYDENSPQYDHVLNRYIDMEKRQAKFKKIELEVKTDNIEYTVKIDKIRLRLKCEEEEEYRYLLNCFLIFYEGKMTVEENYFTGHRINQYHHNHVMNITDELTGEKFVIYIAYEFNANKDKSLVIEYNPQKLKRHWRGWDRIKMFIYERLNRVELQTYDVAFDLKGIKTTEIVYDSNMQYEKQERVYRDSKTIYIGKKFCKIYDKKKEYKDVQGIELDHELTRIEFTISPSAPVLGLEYIDINYPQIPTFYFRSMIHVEEENELAELKPLDRWILTAIIDNPEVNRFDMLPRKKKEKLRDYLKVTEFAPSTQLMEQCLNQYLLYEYNI